MRSSEEKHCTRGMKPLCPTLEPASRATCVEEAEDTRGSGDRGRLRAVKRQVVPLGQTACKRNQSQDESPPAQAAASPTGVRAVGQARGTVIEKRPEPVEPQRNRSRDDEEQDIGRSFNRARARELQRVQRKGELIPLEVATKELAKRPDPEGQDDTIRREEQPSGSRNVKAPTQYERGENQQGSLNVRDHVESRRAKLCAKRETEEVESQQHGQDWPEQDRAAIELRPRGVSLTWADLREETFAETPIASKTQAAIFFGLSKKIRRHFAARWQRKLSRVERG